MTTELKVRAVFRFTSNDAVDRLRTLLPEAHIEWDDQTVRVRAFYDDRQHGPAVLPEGAESRVAR